MALADAKTAAWYSTNLPTWDFNDIWAISEGTSYPYFKYQSVAEVAKYSVTFTVAYVDGTAITDAVVSFNEVANAAGEYVFADIVAGTYTYSVVRQGYETVSGSLTVSDANVVKDITLQYPVAIESVDANDAIVATKYYNLQGIEVVPAATGVYIVKNIHASGKFSSSKELKVVR
jgi:hypothetical protein